MLTMQAFHDWLFLPTGTADTGKRRLARLTRASRDQIRSIASEQTWYVWGAPQA